jgi:ankyrin repeat protein
MLKEGGVDTAEFNISGTTALLRAATAARFEFTALLRAVAADVFGGLETVQLLLGHDLL